MLRTILGKKRTSVVIATGQLTSACTATPTYCSSVPPTKQRGTLTVKVLPAMHTSPPDHSPTPRNTKRLATPPNNESVLQTSNKGIECKDNADCGEFASGLGGHQEATSSSSEFRGNQRVAADARVHHESTTNPRGHQENSRRNGRITADRCTQTHSLHCIFCRITFADEVMFSLHMGCHSHRDPFICNVCGQTNSDRYAFYTHIMRGHTCI